LYWLSTKFTIAFSNTPGPVKPFFQTNSKGEISYARWCKTYIVASGRVATNVSCVSFGDSFTVSVTADEAVCPKTRFFCGMIV